METRGNLIIRKFWLAFSWYLFRKPRIVFYLFTPGNHCKNTPDVGVGGQLALLTQVVRELQLVAQDCIRDSKHCMYA